MRSCRLRLAIRHSQPGTRGCVLRAQSASSGADARRAYFFEIAAAGFAATSTGRAHHENLAGHGAGEAPGRTERFFCPRVAGTGAAGTDLSARDAGGGRRGKSRLAAVARYACPGRISHAAFLASAAGWLATRYIP